MISPPSQTRKVFLRRVANDDWNRSCPGIDQYCVISSSYSKLVAMRMPSHASYGAGGPIFGVREHGNCVGTRSYLIKCEKLTIKISFFELL